MKLAVCLSLSMIASVASADVVSVMDNNKEITTDCSKDKEFNLVGNNIKLTMTGTCTKVTATGNHANVSGSVTEAHLIGNHNVYALDGVDTIKVIGNHNTVTYKKPLAKKKTTVGNLGKKNKISVVK
jgi:hypothetical protein